MRYSSVNHWYKIQEVLGGLEGTSPGEVQIELLKHLSSSHIRAFELDGTALAARPIEGEAMIWKFRSLEAADHFVKVVCEWFKAQGVHVPAC